MANLTEQQQRMIEDYLEGRLPGEARLRLEKWLGENPSGQEYLHFLEKLKGIAPDLSQVTPPADLVDRIMSRIEGRKTTLVSPLPWAKAGLAFTCLAVVFFAGLHIFHPGNLVGPQKATLEVPFLLNAPGARQVELAGDFTGWKKIPLKQEGGKWKVQLPISTGQDYQYAFVLNGSVFLLDPHQPQAVRDRQGDFYSVLSLGQKEPEMKKTNVTEKTGASTAALMVCLSVFLPEAAFADTAPAATALSHLQQKAESAGLNASESKALVEKARKLEETGLTDATLEALVVESLSLGKGSAAQKALDRAGFLVAQGLDAEEAGKVSLKEVETTRKEQEKALDQDMAQTLASGLKKHAATSQPLVLSQKEMAEKLEQKREEWEERLENQKRIQAIQNDSLEQHK